MVVTKATLITTTDNKFCPVCIHKEYLMGSDQDYYLCKKGIEPKQHECDGFDIHPEEKGSDYDVCLLQSEDEADTPSREGDDNC